MDNLQLQLNSSCKIINPLDGGSTTVKRRSAVRMVRAGKAVFVNAQGQTMGVETNTIKFLASAHDQAQEHLVDNWLWEQRLKLVTNSPTQDMGYDQVRRMLNSKELRALPFVGNPDTLFEKQRGSTRRPLGHNGPVVTIAVN